jgi:phosphoribosylformylglycinamidine (FGAM) synthase-like enzyme
VRATVVGTVTPGDRLRILDRPGGEVLADVPAASLHDESPKYERPLRPPADLEARRADDPALLPAPADCGPDLLAMLVDTSWVWNQYDHQLFLNTIEGPGGDAAVLRLKAPGLAATGKALAVTTDSNSRWCGLDPRRGTALVVAEGILNLACVGARPLAVVNCLNFGNPEHPEVMWQLSEAVDGMREACLALGVPVVGGNVSLYNESGGADIQPTPVIGLLGLVEHLDRRPPGAGLVDGGDVVLFGPPATTGLAGSRWAWEAHGHLGGVVPPLDAATHMAVAELVRGLVSDGLLAGVHDVADGGLGLALAEMAVRSGVGASVLGLAGLRGPNAVAGLRGPNAVAGLRGPNAVAGLRGPSAAAGHAALFSEEPSRVVACVAPAAVDEVTARATAAGVALTRLGRAGGDRLVVEGLVNLAVDDAGARWRSALPRVMGE